MDDGGFGCWNPSYQLQANFDERELGERAHYLLEYDPATGSLVSRFSREIQSYAVNSGHHLIRIDKKSFSAAVIVWVMHHFAKPAKTVFRHINKVSQDHRIENLLAGRSEVIASGRSFVPKAVTPGRMPVYLPREMTKEAATHAIADYVAAHRKDPPPPCPIPESVVKELVKIGYAPKQYAPGESRLNSFQRTMLQEKPRPRPMRQDIDDLI